MSVGVVDKSTGDRIQTAGDPLDKVGNLANLTTTAKDNAVNAINEVNAGLATKADITDLAPAFSTSTDYTVGQYVSYDGNIYKCTSAHSAGAWVAGDFTLVAVGSELSEINSNLTNLTDAVGWSGHNYLVNDDHTEEKNGVTFTLNADGTWTVDGTATADTVKTISRQKDFTFAGGKLLSGCPNISGLSLRLAKNTSPYTQYAIDSGNGVTIPAQTMDQTVAIIVVENGTHVDNAVVRPMISDNVIPYVPYHPVIGTTVEELQSGMANLKFLPVNFTDTFEANATLTNGVTVSDLTGGILTNDSRIKGIVMYNVYPFYMFQLQYQGKIMLGTDVPRSSQETITNRMVIMYI